MTATTEVVISEKSMLEFCSVEFSAMEVSRISTMRILRPALLKAAVPDGPQGRSGTHLSPSLCDQLHRSDGSRLSAALRPGRQGGRTGRRCAAPRMTRPRHCICG